MLLIKGVGISMLFFTTTLFFCTIGFGRSFVSSNSVIAHGDLQRNNLSQTFGLQSQQNDNQNDQDDNNAIDQMDAIRAEQEAARKVSQRLMLPQLVVTSISQSVSALAWGFLILSFILQALGYAFVMDDSSGLRIDTLEARQFQDEIMKSMKEKRE